MFGFTLSDEQEQFRVAVRAWAEKALAPRVEELEAREEFPLDLFRELGRLGYLGQAPDLAGAVVRFQRDAQLLPDGVIGARTLMSLYSRGAHPQPRLMAGGAS